VRDDAGTVIYKARLTLVGEWGDQPTYSSRQPSATDSSSSNNIRYK
jgi:hypothetical protein